MWIQTTVWWHKDPGEHESLLSGITSYLWSIQSVGPSPTPTKSRGFWNLYMQQTSKKDKTVSLTVVFSSSTRFGSSESGLKVTILDVEYTGRRNSFPTHTVWTSSLSPVKVEKKVSTFSYLWWNVACYSGWPTLWRQKRMDYIIIINLLPDNPEL